MIYLLLSTGLVLAYINNIILGIKLRRLEKEFMYFKSEWIEKDVNDFLKGSKRKLKNPKLEKQRPKYGNDNFVKTVLDI